MNREEATELIVSFFDPLVDALESAEGERALFSSLGFVLPDGLSIISGTRDAVMGLFGVALELDALPDDASEEELLSLLIKTLDAVRVAALQADKIADAFGPDVTNSPLVTETDLLEVLPRRLLDLLTATFLARRLRTTHAVLQLLGLIERVPRVINGDQHRTSFVETIVYWERLPRIVTEPLDLLSEVYGWGAANGLDTLKLFLNLRALGVSLGIRAELDTIDSRAKTAFELGLSGGATVPEGDDSRILRVPLLPMEHSPLGIEMYPVADAAGHVDGLGLGFYIEPQIDVMFELTDKLRAEVEFSAHIDGFGVLFRNGQDPKVLGPVFVDGAAGVVANASLDAKVTFTLGEPDGSPLVLIGSAKGTHFETGAIRAAIAVSKEPDADPDIAIEAAIEKGAIVVRAGEGDGFLKSVLGDGFTVPFDLAMGVSTKRGFYISGGAGMTFTLRVDQSLGPLFVDSIEISVGVGDSGGRLAIAVTGGLEIGPFVGVVSGIGIQAKIDTTKRGLLGAADLAVGFKPPTGIGLSINTSTVRAGGFLSIDPEAGRYYGAIELSLLKKFDLVVIGIVTTKMPDGSDGFSLLFLIAFTFPTPIHIAYNFYLAGVGGMLGLNRSVDIDRLRSGLQSGVADSILFPKDVVRRIGQIVTDLEQVFPNTQGQFLVGPMAIITWSSPPLIRVKLGLIIEFANPVRIAILGVLRAALPDEDEPILDLKVNFLGAVDFDAGMLSFDASIFDSYIGKKSFRIFIEGDIALRISWGRNKDFVASVGGFHPKFNVPAYLKLPAMKRVKLSLLKDNPRLSLSTYFAITTNTIQLGAHLDFLFKASDFSVVGDFGFDVLFQFSPFRFEAAICAHLAVKMGGNDILTVALDFNLTGPTPWIAQGSASFQILFFSASVSFYKRFGEDAAASVPTIDVLPIVMRELARDANWKGELSAGASALVQLIPAKLVAGQILVDCAGRVSVGQNVLPLETELERFGNNRINDAQRVRILSLSFGGDVVPTSPTEEDFAPTAFQNLSDAQKLDARSYERRASGVISGEVGVLADDVLTHTVKYERVVSDTLSGEEPKSIGLSTEPRERFEAQVPGGAVSRSAQARATAIANERAPGAVTLKDDAFAVVRSESLTPVDEYGVPVSPLPVEPELRRRVLLSRNDAEERLKKLVKAGRTDLLVVPEYQVAA